MLSSLHPGQPDENVTKCTQNPTITYCNQSAALTLICTELKQKIYDFYCESNSNEDGWYHCVGCNVNFTKDLLVNFFSSNISDFIIRVPDAWCHLSNKSDDVFSSCKDSTDISWGRFHYDWSFLFVVVFITAGGLGNILVCLAVLLDRRLQNVTNYFLLSLAIADLLVSLFVMPLGAIPGFLGKLLSID